MAIYSHGALFVLLVCLHYAETYGPYIGCYKDGQPRAMGTTDPHVDDSMTIGLCEQLCRSNTPYTFLGANFAKVCFCHDSYNRFGNASESECNTTCKGDSSQKCGSDWRISVYAVCQAGSWGQDCHQQCNCEVCMRRSGICSSPCFAGWLGANCDVPDCSFNNSDCEHICNESSDETWCSCVSGYYLNADEKGCSDINECVNGSHQCSAGDDFCVNTQGGYSCSCPEGYGLQKDNHTCADIHECRERLHNCSEGVDFCHNIKGGYTCSCPVGYRMESDNHTCTDIHECIEGLHNCSEGVDCHNIKGGYTCSCPAGYRMESDDHTCTEATSSNSQIGLFVGIPVGLLVIIAIATTILVIVLIRRGAFRRCRKSGSENRLPDVIHESSNHGPENAATPVPTAVGYVKGVVSLSPSKISLTELEGHMERLRSSGQGFQLEFKQISDDNRDTCDVAEAPAVKDKNKFINILPYDHNRVVLRGKPTDGISDYINASYIKIGNKNEYIATQGPQKIGTEEFWEMVWQEGTHVIVMLTNPVEDAKVKCIEYWPLEGTKKYGGINITMAREERMPDFVRRTLIIGTEGKEREIHQYHFKTWPDHGVPGTATGILKMLYKVREEATHGKPIIVHCSAGVGRTGTYIAIDQQLKQAETEGTLDVLACVDELRNSRMDMVQTADQYKFIYTAVFEATSTGPTSIPCASYLQAGKCKQDIMKAAKTHYKFLKSTKVIPQEEQLSAGRAAENAKKNKSDKNIPTNLHRVFLREDGNDYINASFIEGFSRRSEFITTQLPLENTTGDFWRMMFDYNCKTLLILESEDTLQDEPCFLPNESTYAVTHGNFTVIWKDEREEKNHKILMLELMEGNVPEESIYANTPSVADTQSRAKTEGLPLLGIQVMKITGSMTTEVVRESFAQILRWEGHDTTSPVVVVCKDGVSKCGLYIAASFLLNMVNYAQEVDVFYATRTIRKYRHEFITSERQYCCLHTMAAEYLDNYDTYSNF